MGQKPHSLERAFQLAKSGSCASVAEIKLALKSERYTTEHITGASLSAQLKALIEEARAVA